jgi:hypothetical protein
MTKFTATFSDGQTITRNSDHRYAFAWALIGIEYGQIEASGMSATRANAAKNAQAQLWAPVSARDRRNAALHRLHAKMAKEKGFASVACLHAHWDAEAVKHNADFRIEIVEVRGA